MIACLLLSLASAEAPAPALLAQGASAGTSDKPALSYTYLQVDLLRGDGDGFSTGPNGFDLKGSFGLAKNFFAFGGIDHLNGKSGGSSIDVNTFELGLGFYTPVDPRADLVLRGSLLHAKADSGAPGSSGDGNGYSVSVGLRSPLSKELEVDGAIGFTDYDNSDSDTWLEAGALWHATPNLGMRVGLYTADHYDALMFGLRWQP